MSFLFSLSGRFGRLQWWAVQGIGLLAIALYIAVAVTFLPADIAASGELDEPSLPASYIASGLALILFLTWINIASTVKRFHDRDKSGVWFLIVFVPLIGGFWQIIECGFLSGSPGSNSYGGPPGRSAMNLDLDDSGEMPAWAVRALERGPEPAAKSVPAPRASAPQPAASSRPAKPSGFGRRGIA